MAISFDPSKTILFAISPTAEALLIIALALVTGLGLFWFLYFALRKQLAKALTERRPAKITTIVVLGILTFIVMGIAVEAIDFSELSEAKELTPARGWAVFGVIFGASILISAQAALSLVEEDVNESLKRLRFANKKLDDDLKAARESIKQAQRRTEFNRRVSEVFLEVVTQKHDSLRDYLSKASQNGTNGVTIPGLKQAFDPHARCTVLLQKLFYIFDRWIEERGKADRGKADLRIVYFRSDGNYLRVEHCWNRRQDRNCVSIPDASLEHFNVRSGDSMVVVAAKDGQICISENADFDSDKLDHPFIHFDGDGEIRSRGIIKSAICFPVGSPELGHCRHVIWLDCNVVNFFHNGYLEQYRFILDHLQRRFLYEIELGKIFQNV